MAMILTVAKFLKANLEWTVIILTSGTCIALTYLLRLLQNHEKHLSVAESLMVGKAKSEFEKMPLGQRVALCLIYRTIKIHIADLTGNLKALGFADPSGSIVTPLRATSLVLMDNIFLVPNPQPAIARSVDEWLGATREALGSAPLPGGVSSSLGNGE